MMAVKRKLKNALLLKGVIRINLKLNMRSNGLIGTKMLTYIARKTPLFTFKAQEILRLLRERLHMSFGKSQNAIKILGTIHK